MLVPFLWIIGSYAACIVMVHTVHWLKKTDSTRLETWVIITHNHQHKVEWTLRTLLLAAWIQGKATNLIVIDRSSTDDTLRIIQRLARHNPFQWEVVHSEEEFEQVMHGLALSSVSVLDLERSEHNKTAPQFY